MAMQHISAGRGIAERDGRHDVVVFVPVEGSLSAAEVAARVSEFVAAGATDIALLLVGDGPPLEDFVRFAAREVRALVG